MWPRRPWVQVPSLTQFSGYSVVRLTRLLWEQEIGSSNLSTPTLENAKYLSTKALLVSGAFTFNDYQSLSFIPINGTKKTGQKGHPASWVPSTHNSIGTPTEVITIFSLIIIFATFQHHQERFHI